MIQIKEAESWGVPAFIRPEHVFWHSDYDKEEKNCSKWGGFDKETGKPCSNTKVWVELHHLLPRGIRKVFALGGGDITLKEMQYTKKAHIPVHFIPMERRFKGDGTTAVQDGDSITERYGEIMVDALKCNL